ncbi:YDG/SRA domain-containing protein [Neobacillus rhizosphaerae]|uniref:YDG/SRA domain-containing protein n=1 Tax=Neobacillus rhizosphaerae TaxID=2880965 RepID=UPI003D2A9542
MGEYLSVAKIASLTGRHEETVRRWIREGIFKKTIKGLNNMTLVSEEEVISYMSGKTSTFSNIVDHFRDIEVCNSSTWNLLVGDILTFESLKTITNCPTVKGIRYRSGDPNISIITTVGSAGSKASNPYEDRFEEGVLYYTGEGRKGNQKLTSGNLRLYEAEMTKLPIHVFQKLDVDQYVFLGMFQVISHHTEKQPDANNLIRDVFVFELKPIIDKSKSLSKESTQDNLLKEIDDLQKQFKNEKLTKQTLEIRYQHSRKLVESFKKLYNYNCQLCDPNKPIPPITMKGGEKYMEVHHIQGNSEVIGKGFEQDEGHYVIDSINNIICVCPYHHKLLHHCYPKVHFNRSTESFEAEDRSLILPINLKHPWHLLG